MKPRPPLPDGPYLVAGLARSGEGIVEVNAAPGFRMHTHPTEGEPQ